MKNKIKKVACGILVAVFAIQPISVMASDDLLYEKKTVQTITSGVTYEKSERLYKAGWMDVYVLTLDMNNPNVALEVIESAGEYGLKKSVENLAKENNVLAAVNADFFGSGNPTSSMGQVVKDGEMVATQNYYNGSENKYAGFYIDNENVPFIDYVKSSIGFYNSATAVIQVGAKNKVNGFSSPVYFDINAFKTTADLDKRYKNLTKIVVENDVIVQISEPGQTVTVPDAGYIIVMSDATRQEKISYYAVGQSVSFNENEAFVFRPQKSIASIKLGISGGGEMLRNGEIIANGLIIGQNGRNPRTMIGVNRDKSKVMIVCIDGRANGIGATHTEAAGIMKEYGAWDAMHFDGGGSTTMVAKEENTSGLSVVNVPSEGSQRLVANGLGVKSANEPGEVKELNVVVSNSEDGYMFDGVGFEMEVYGYDENHNMTDIDLNKLRYAASIEGEWKDNKFTPDTEGNGTITVTYVDNDENPIAVGRVDIKVLKGASTIHAKANTKVLTVGQSTKLNASMINRDGYSIDLDTEDVQWTVDNSELGYVNEQGYFVATGNGVAQITATNKGVSATVNVCVGKTTTLINSFEQTRNMIMYYFPEDSGITAGAGISANAAYDGNSSLQFNYNFKTNLTTTQATYVSFEKQPIELPNNATDLCLWYKGDGKGNMLKAVIKDATGKTYNVLLSQAMDTTEWTQAVAAMPEGVTYPVTLDKIYVAALNTTDATAQGTVYIDQIAVMAPMSPVADVINQFTDYMNTDLSWAKAEGQEDITVFGQTKESKLENKAEVLNNIMAKMAVGSRAMLFVGANDFQNNTGVTSVAWNNEYYTTNTENFSIVNLATGNGSIRSSSPNQWRWLQGYLESYSKNNIVINMDKNIWGESGTRLNDSRERDLLHDILRKYVADTGKNIVVVSASGTSDSVTVKDGVRYINLCGLSGANYSYLKLRGDSDNMYYQIVQAN